MDAQETELMAKAVREGMFLAFKDLAKDTEFAKAFWEQGYIQLSTHAERNASQWVGKRIITWFALSIGAAILAYLIRSGALK